MFNPFQSIKRGLTIMSLCFSMFFEHPRFVLFPLLISAIVFIFAGFLLLGIYSTIGLEGLMEFLDLFSKKTPSVPQLTDYVVLIFSIMAINFFFIFWSSLIAVATTYFTFQLLNNNKVGFFEAIVFSFTKLRIIVQWTSLSVFIHMLINWTKNKKSGRSWFLDFIGILGTLSWNLITFFIMPVITFDRLGLIDSIKKSAQIMKKTFGETMTASMGFSIFSIFFIIPIPVGTLVLVLLLKNYWIMLGIPLLVVTGCLHAFLFGEVVVLTSILSTIHVIFKTVVYSYVTGHPVGKFPIDLIEASFDHKELVVK